MKKSSILMSVMLPLAGYAQELLFTVPTAQWHVTRTFPNGSEEQPEFVQSETSLFLFDGDTLIDGAVWLDIYSSPTWGGGGPQEFAGRVQQIGDLVLLREPDGTLDTLYWFGLQAGDPVRYDLPGLGVVYLTVDSVTSSFIAGVERRIYHFSTSWEFAPFYLTDRWIEGIGSVHGPLFPRHPHLSFPAMPDSLWLVCYSQQGSVLYTHPAASECEYNIITHVNPDITTTDIALYPNPGNDQVWLSGLNALSAHTLIITDVQGRVVYNGRVHTDQPVNTRDLPSGCSTPQKLDR